MLFNSVAFIGFFFVFFWLFYFCPVKIRPVLLLAGSLFFYFFTEKKLIIYPVVFSVVAFFSARFISSGKNLKWIFHFVLILFIGALVYLKYFKFFGQGIGTVLGKPQLITSFNAMQIIAPLGVSYFTFQLIGYLIDVKRNEIQPERNFLSFLNFVFYFPKIVSGPVEKAQSIIPQFSNKIIYDYPMLKNAVSFIFWGFFQKVVVADKLANLTSSAWSHIDNYSHFSLFLLIILFFVQLYADFAGYTNMAIGVSKLLGVELTQNFNRPFSAASVTEFWRRWHISLSNWFNQYLFTPLSINTRNWGAAGIIFSVTSTFVLLGLWHGASLGFIIFGFLQGTAIAVEMLTKKFRKKIKKSIGENLIKAGGIILTFIFLSIATAFFKSPSFSTTLLLFKNMIIGNGKDSQELLSVFNLILVLILVTLLLGKEFLEEKKQVLKVWNNSAVLRWSSYSVMIVFICLFGQFHSDEEFIYLKF